MQVNPHREDSVPFWSVGIVGALLLVDLAGYSFGLWVVFHAVTTAERRRRRDGMNDRATNDG
jgi:hypothetical protein